MTRPLTIGILLLAGAVIGASDPYTEVRREFVQAYVAVNPAAMKGVAKQASSTTASDSAALQAYLLYPYLKAARLQRDLQLINRDVKASDQAIENFLSEQKNAPVGRELRRLWLVDLAARREWSLFQANYSSNPDAELRCLAATAQLTPAPTAEQTAILSAALNTLWLTATRLPAACNTPFEWARTNQIISAAAIEQRARLTLKAGNVDLARELAAMLPAAQAAPLKQWALLIEKPQPAIDTLIASSATKVESAALQDGWSRLARKDQDAAIERLPRLKRARGLNEVDASPYALSLALALSWSRRDEALRYFDQVLPADMNEQALEWRARSALWKTDWPRVQQSILALPDALKNQARWRYWLARAAEQLNDAATARSLYQALVANDDNYYAAMAAAHLQVAYTPHPQPLPVDDAAAQALAKQPGMQRAHELWLVQLRNEATLEWTQVFATLQPGEHLVAAQLARDWDWYDQAVATTAKLGLYNDYEFLFPRPYQAEVTQAAQLSGLSTDLIYAVMRQETLFRADAQSNANARGLLQLLPVTARMVARKAKLPTPEADDLFDPQVNVPLGALYLKSLSEDMDDQLIMALAAYNAGPAATRRWLPEHAMAADIWIENIPFNETRAYVQRVLWYSLVFHWLGTGRPVEVQDWLAPLQP